VSAARAVRAYAPGPYGQIHYATAGTGAPVLLLHQTPRSFDEYCELIPLLAAEHRVIAMDTPGYGASDPPLAHSIEAYAEAVLALIDHLELKCTAVMGHHTGGVIAVDVAARAKGKVDRLILSSTPYVDAEARARRVHREPIDRYVSRDDGTHLLEAWQGRQRIYPAERPDLLDRYIRDLLVAGTAAELGHQAVGGYEMERSLPKITCPVLCIGATADLYSYPELPTLTRGLADARTCVIDGGSVALMEERATDIAAAVLEFLRKDDAPGGTT
jgi:pimeloyl-ACP methyl ester carboxylesterase